MKKFWSKQKCINEAKKYTCVREWRKISGGSYVAAYRNGWLNKCCSHMVYGNRYKRLIYAFEFPDNSVYVGLTFNIEKRKNEHFTNQKSSVYKHMIKTNVIPKLVQLTKYIDVNLAKTKEGYYLNKYVKKNWLILNRVKTGSLGGNILKYTKQICQNDANKYSSRREWYEKSPTIYDAARRNKWIDECCGHMVLKKHPDGYWTKEKCIEDAKKYSSRSEWQINSKTIYGIARKNDWLMSCCQHMKLLHLPNGYWTKEKCIEDAKKYNTRTEWRVKSSSASTIAGKNKWLKECYAHMQ